MKTFISCDWGTSALRLRLVDADSITILAETTSLHGISSIYELWSKAGKTAKERIPFYQSILAEQIKELEKQTHVSLNETPLIISGMTSSSIGMIELPYNEIPFYVNPSDFNLKTIKASDEFKHAILIISGIKTNDDAMRGEETQLIGCMDEENKEEQLFIFPGTHSKHVTVSNGHVTDIKTYMTGEFFDLLSAKSILSGSVEKGEGLQDKRNMASFKTGVTAGKQSDLLSASFKIRANHLFEKLSKIENYYYLSGLLIGTELKELKKGFQESITLVVNESLLLYYSVALTILGFKEGLDFVIENADRSLIKGQIKIYNELKN